MNEPESLSLCASLLGRRLHVFQGDITREEVDAIVTAANRTLSGGNQAGFGGGVDGAIHRAAGPSLLQASLALGGCPHGEAVATHAGNLKARRVIHAVGPIYGSHGGADDKLLASAHRRSLEVAAAEGCASLVFPAISCGVYKFPVERAARIALSAIRDFLVADDRVRLVRYCLFTESDFWTFASALDALSNADARVVLEDS